MGMIENRWFCIVIGRTAGTLFEYQVVGTGRSFAIGAPAFEIDGRLCEVACDSLRSPAAPRALANGQNEYVCIGELRGASDAQFELVLRLAPDNAVVRFCYRLRSEEAGAMTRASGRDNLRYLSLALPGMACKELRVSEFDESIHSFRPTEHPLPERAFEDGLAAQGPLLIARDDAHALVLAYEHGSQVPDAFLQFELAPDRRVSLQAIKGNYVPGYVLSAAAPYESIWLQFAAVAGGEDDLARHYRAFVLRHQTLNAASRRPYIFYNTWCYQERNKWWSGKRYLDSMNQERIEAEIDVAHRMGIDVFVLDTGWYAKTGDWAVNRRFFPDGLQSIHARLDGYGMKLGLWFSPTQAAVSSRMCRDHADCRITWNGKLSGPHGVWETEESYSMCLVSRYWQAFADELIRLVREVGVTYFKWDAVGQYGCNDAGHWHGTAANSAAQRADSYAFELGRYMARVVDRVCAACPEAIVDFDITEGGRYVGLGFLSAGKYFLINNGPYFPSLDHPYDWSTATYWSNVFVYPGPARARVCRAPLDYDRWIPSVLFLTHYLPDDPRSSQVINLASLVLGQNGIWGDLPAISAEGVELFGRTLGVYKQVREDITESFPVRTGIAGGSPEIHEKIAAETGRGVVAVFAGAAGCYTYVTANRAASGHWVLGDVEVTRDAAGRARLECTFRQPGAMLVFFGVRG